MDGPEKLLRAAREDVNRFPPWIRLYTVIILIVIIEVKPQHIFRTRNLPKFLTPNSEIRDSACGPKDSSSRCSPPGIFGVGGGGGVGWACLQSWGFSTQWFNWRAGVKALCVFS